MCIVLYCIVLITPTNGNVIPHVCLSVCLSVTRISQKVIVGFKPNFAEL